MLEETGFPAHRWLPVNWRDRRINSYWQAGLIGAGTEECPESPERAERKGTWYLYKLVSPLPTGKAIPSLPSFGLNSPCTSYSRLSTCMKVCPFHKRLFWFLLTLCEIQSQEKQWCISSLNSKEYLLISGKNTVFALITRILLVLFDVSKMPSWLLRWISFLLKPKCGSQLKPTS